MLPANKARRGIAVFTKICHAVSGEVTKVVYHHHRNEALSMHFNLTSEA